MFGIEFSELFVCLLVALIVLGPKELPAMVRTVALWIGRIKRSLHETRESFEQQMGMEEVRRQLHTEDMMRTLKQMDQEIDSALYYDKTPVALPAIESSFSHHSVTLDSTKNNSASV